MLFSFSILLFSKNSYNARQSISQYNISKSVSFVSLNLNKSYRKPFSTFVYILLTSLDIVASDILDRKYEHLKIEFLYSAFITALFFLANTFSHSIIFLKNWNSYCKLWQYTIILQSSNESSLSKKILNSSKLLP